MRWEVTVSDSITLSDSVSATMTPADEEYDWRRRWQEVQRELDALGAPQTESMSTASIHAAADRLRSFFIKAYHLKDALKADKSAHGVANRVIEAAITADPDLALVADLANLDKHLKLSRRARSGDTPATGELQGTTIEPSGWRLVMPISHGGKTIDGLAAADAAVAAWRRHLGGWGVI